MVQKKRVKLKWYKKKKSKAEMVQKKRVKLKWYKKKKKKKEKKKRHQHSKINGA